MNSNVTFYRNGDSVEVNGNTYSEGERFTVDKTEVFIQDGELKAIAYSSEDILKAESVNNQRAMMDENMYPIALTVSKEAAVRSMRLMQNYRSKEKSPHLMRQSGDKARINITKDGQEITQLIISKQMVREPMTNRFIQVPAGSPEQKEEAKRLLGVLKSGVLKTSINNSEENEEVGTADKQVEEEKGEENNGQKEEDTGKSVEKVREQASYSISAVVPKPDSEKVTIKVLNTGTVKLDFGETPYTVTWRPNGEDPVNVRNLGQGCDLGDAAPSPGSSMTCTFDTGGQGLENNGIADTIEFRTQGVVQASYSCNYDGSNYC